MNLIPLRYIEEGKQDQDPISSNNLKRLQAIFCVLGDVFDFVMVESYKRLKFCFLMENVLKW